MKIDFGTFETAADLKAELEKHVFVGQSTIEDVQQFLYEQNTDFGTYENTGETRTVSDRLTKHPYDNYISVREPIPKKPL